MSLFIVAKSTTAFFKGGIYGFQGAGKTFTAVEIMIGLYHFLKANKPIYFLDTETGSDWAIPRFKKEGIELRVAKTRAFVDLCAGVREAEKEGFGLIVDSASHYWRELMESYMSRYNVKRMAIHHWTPLKKEWAQFTELLVNSKLHMMVAGRAGWEYDMEEDETGKKDLIKTGTKMKAEGEFGFEPSLVLEMERIRVASNGVEVGEKKEGKKERASAKIGDKILHRCHVIKDRRMDDLSMDGKSIDNPKFEDFLPHIEALNFGGEHLGVDTSRNSEDMFEPEGGSWREERIQREVLLAEIQQTLTDAFPSRNADDLRAKADLLEVGSGTRTWDRVEKLERDYPATRLRDVLAKIKDEIPEYKRNLVEAIRKQNEREAEEKEAKKGKKK